MDADLASIQDARDCLAVTRRAFEAYREFSQDEVDRICTAMVEAGYAAARELAELAVDETGIGRVDGKLAKNRFATRGVWRWARDLKTCGLVRSDDRRRVYEYADPFGVVAAIIPTTNPTSTALFKAIICMKARCGMVTSPHPRAIRCIEESIRVVHDAAVDAGAPEGILTCMSHVTLEGTNELMRHRDTDLILATGGMGLVRAAYASGKPAFGVGPGNCPAYVDRSADLSAAAHAIVDSQTFDNSTICASEQSLVLDAPIRDPFLEEMRRRGAWICGADEARLLGRICMRGKGMNPEIVGRDPWQLARMAGFDVPRETTVLLADCDGVGPEYPLSIEKLSPILSVFTEDGWERGCARCIEILRFGGMGHTLAIHCRDEHVIREFAAKKPVNRIVVNSPAAQGSVGFTTGLSPSMTLGCGSFGGNITSDNIGPLHLLNIKRLAYVDPDYGTERWRDDFPLDDTERGTPAAAGSASTWESRAATNSDSRTRKLWRPRPEAVSSAPSAPGELFSREDLQQIIEQSLAKRREDECPFGRCADCPPDAGTCQSPQRREESSH